ncbi:MAG: acylphosphatase [candidate division WOR-3 bacterium]
MKKRVHLLIYGRVQGVFYRAFTKEKADLYGIKGWVRNLRDGRVEAVGEGEEELLKEWIKDLWKGPELAIVKEINEEWSDNLENFPDFEIRYF